MEEIKYIFGVKILGNQKICKVYVNLQKYVENVLKMFGMKDCKPLASPLDSNCKFTRDMSPQIPRDINIIKKICF